MLTWLFNYSFLVDSYCGYFPSIGHQSTSEKELTNPLGSIRTAFEAIQRFASRDKILSSSKSNKSHNNPSHIIQSKNPESSNTFRCQSQSYLNHTWTRVPCQGKGDAEAWMLKGGFNLWWDILLLSTGFISHEPWRAHFEAIFIGSQSCVRKIT